MIKRKVFIYIFAAVLLLVWFGSSLAGLITDWYWFDALGFGNIFTTVLNSQIFIFLIVAAVTFGLVYLNLKIASRLTRGRAVRQDIKQREGGIGVEKLITRISLGVSTVIGFFTGLLGATNWQTILKFFNSTSFGFSDPIFSKDISFYIFSLPFIELVFGILLWILFVSLAGVGIIYFIKGVLSFKRKRQYYVQDSSKGRISGYKVEKPGRTHLFTLLFFFLGGLALQIYLVKIPKLLYSKGELFTGAGYTDIHAILPVLKILAFILIVAAIISLINIFRNVNKYFLFTVAAYVVVLILGTWIYPLILQKLVVEPNEIVKESTYISYNIEATQKAFGLDEVEEKQLSGEDTLSMKDINENKGTIRNVRLWDREPLLDTFSQVQEIRTYYDFSRIDNDRYTLGDEYRQTLLSPRELNSNNLPNPTFINKHLTFTHGYVLVVSPVNEVTKEGLPVLFVKDIPPVSSSEELRVERPGIYYGQMTDSYAVAKTAAKEFDYPSGEENVFTDYEGKGGVEVKNLFRRFLYSIRFGEIKILFSGDIDSQSRVMYSRNVEERIKKILPFLELDSDAYMIVTEDGKLKWIIDGYTVSSRYPYSRKLGGINYIKNSVKAVVDAYDGDVNFYIADPNDPLIKTYSKIFKDTFLNIEDMPDDIRAHVRYPEDLFVIQTSLYSTYHMEEPQIFYNKEDQWEVPRISEGRRDSMIRHIIMRLPEEDGSPEFILMIPFTPQGKNNMAAWMVARSDGENYGQLLVYKFPKQKLVFGPAQVISRINQNPDISRQISLWDQRGSEVNLGPLLVIPIGKSLIYVRPLYIRAEGGSIPELKRVIVAYENRIAMRKTLNEALEVIFEGGVEVSTEELEESFSGNITEEANRIFQEAMEAQRQGDWSLYGEKIKRLGEILAE